jgi:hypothetical protein
VVQKGDLSIKEIVRGESFEKKAERCFVIE